MMKLRHIDKNRYRSHLNQIIIGFIVVFTVLALVFGQLLITLISPVNTNHFRYNLAGVVLALLACGTILSQLRKYDYFDEVYYIWQLKQVLNSIYRKLKIIKQKAAENDVNAIIILNYYYQACQQLYSLDDNTITLSSLVKNFDQLKIQISQLNLVIKTDDFNKNMLTLMKNDKP